MRLKQMWVYTDLLSLLRPFYFQVSAMYILLLQQPEKESTRYLVKLPALPNLADIKNAFLRDIFSFESFLQQLRRL